MKTLFAALLMLAMATVCYGDTVALTWDPNTETDLAGYHIYRSDTAVLPFKKVGTVPKNVTNYRFDNASTGRTRYYAITAYNTAGQESSYSNIVMLYLMNPPTGLKGELIVTYTLNAVGK